jgi:UDP-glucose 4-epimerase
MKVLVTGGAGYIGAHMVKALSRRGAEVVVLDNLSSGRREAVRDCPLVTGDINNAPDLAAVFAAHHFDAVMHFASLIQVGESVQQPARYYRTNVGGTLNILEAMRTADVRRFIFSSSAAVFGEPSYTPIDEAHPKTPVNPYGFSKLAVERILADYAAAYGMHSISLRYFNAAGADPEGDLGECHDPETHLIPLVLQAASGRRPDVTIFGTDYPTSDGTCVRDYIHVVDLCQAHVLALDYLAEKGRSGAYNLGNNQGFSVRQIIDTAERVSGSNVPVKLGPRRAGDPAVLVADSRKAIAELGWRPQYQALDTIIGHAWAWEQKLARLAKAQTGGSP